MSFVRRPHPFSELSAKRQRVPGENVSLTKLASLPLQVEAVREDYLNAERVSTSARSGIVLAPDGCSYAWMVVGVHVHLWRITASGNSDQNYVRLGTFCQEGFNDQECWIWIGLPSASLSNRSRPAKNFEYTVVLFTSSGQILCWPLGYGSPTCVTMGLQKDDPLVCFTGLSDDQKAFALSSKHGTMYLCWISDRDMGIHFRSVQHDQSAPGEAKESAVFGGVLGLFGLRSAGVAKKSRDLKAGVVTMLTGKAASDIASTNRTLYTVSSDWKLTKWALTWDDTNSGPQLSSNMVWVNDSLKSVLQSDEICLGSVPLGDSSMLLGSFKVSTTSGTFGEFRMLHVSNLDSSTPNGVKCGVASPALSINAPASQSFDPWTEIDVKNRVSFSVRALQHHEQVLVYAHVRLPYDDRVQGKSKTQCVAGITVDAANPDISFSSFETQWQDEVLDMDFGEVDSFTREQPSWSGVVPNIAGMTIISPTSGMFSVRLAALAIMDSHLIEEHGAVDQVPSTHQEKLDHVPLPLAVGTSKLSNEECTNALSRLVKVFLDAHRKGQSGVQSVQHDSDYFKLRDLPLATSLQVVKNVAIANAQRKPGQRWAELRSSEESFIETFSPELILRSLYGKKEQLNALTAIVQGLGVLEPRNNATLSTHDHLTELSQKLDAAVNLCLLQQSFDGELDHFSDFKETLTAAMQKVIQKRGEFPQLDGLVEHLRLSGLSITDMFYAEPANIVELLPVLEKFCEGASFCGLLNQVTLAVASVATTSQYADDGEPSWSDQASLTSALRTRVEKTVVGMRSSSRENQELQFSTSRQLPKILVPLSSNCLETLAAQYYRIVDLYLTFVSPTDTGDEALQEYLEEKERCIFPLLDKCTEVCQVNKNVSETMAALALALGEKYLNYSSLERLCAFETNLYPDASQGIDRLLWYMNHSKSSWLSFTDKEEGEDGNIVFIQSAVGRVLTVSSDGELVGGTGDQKSNASHFKLQNASPNGMYTLQSVSTGKYVYYSPEAKHANTFPSLKLKPKSAVKNFLLSSVVNDNCKFNLETSEDSDYYRLCSFDGTYLCLDTLGSVRAINAVDDWSDFPSHVFQWCIDKENCRALLELTKDRTQSAELSRYLATLDIEYLPDVQKSIVLKLKWLLAIQRKDYDAVEGLARQEASHVLKVGTGIPGHLVYNREDLDQEMKEETARVLKSIAKLSALAV